MPANKAARAAFAEAMQNKADSFGSGWNTVGEAGKSGGKGGGKAKGENGKGKTAKDVSLSLSLSVLSLPHALSSMYLVKSCRNSRLKKRRRRTSSETCNRFSLAVHSGC